MRRSILAVFSILLMILASLVIPAGSQAAPVILSSFMGDPGNHEYNDLAGDENGNQLVMATTFRTDGHMYSLSSITVPLRSWISSNSIPELSVYTNISPDPRRPYTQIGILSGTASVASGLAFSNYLFTAQNIFLEPYGYYWVVLKGSNGSMEWEGIWECNRPLQGWSGVGFLPNVISSEDGGTNWDNFVSGAAMCMIVEAEPVPEPATLLLLGPGLAWIVRRKFKK